MRSTSACPVESYSQFLGKQTFFFKGEAGGKRGRLGGFSLRRRSLSPEKESRRVAKVGSTYTLYCALLLQHRRDLLTCSACSRSAKFTASLRPRPPRAARTDDRDAHYYPAYGMHVIRVLHSREGDATATQVVQVLGTCSACQDNRKSQLTFGGRILA